MQKRTAVRVGSTSTGENTTIAEIYAIALERAGIPVHRHIQLGTDEDVFAALTDGFIDVYPGPVRKHEGKARDVTTLLPIAAIEGPCLAASQYSAEKYWLLTLSTCSAIANRLRLAATPDFVVPGGPLDRLRRAYGGFDFKKLIVCERGTQYYALNKGDADVANAFTTDAAIIETQLVILNDVKHVLPSVRIAPLIRTQTLRVYPHSSTILNAMSGELTQYALRELNRRRSLLDMSAHDAAQDFIDASTRHTANRRS